MSDYPMCNKLSRVNTQRRTIVEFLGWLESDGIVLARPTNDRFGHDSLVEKEDDLLMRFLEIDCAVLESERRSMLDKAAGDE